jgi:hypothetical protein
MATRTWPPGLRSCEVLQREAMGIRGWLRAQRARVLFLSVRRAGYSRPRPRQWLQLQACKLWRVPLVSGISRSSERSRGGFSCLGLASPSRFPWRSRVLSTPTSHLMSPLSMGHGGKVGPLELSRQTCGMGPENRLCSPHSALLGPTHKESNSRLPRAPLNATATAWPPAAALPRQPQPLHPAEPLERA